MADTEMHSPLRAGFTSMVEGTAEDWQIIEAFELERRALLADEVLRQLRLAGDDGGRGYAVDRLTHSLQTATRAERAGRSDAYVLCAVLHDIGDSLAPKNHAEIAAAILKPYVPADLVWMVEHHAEFQQVYYGHFVGCDPQARERYRGHEHFDLTVEFCADFDQNSFDPAYASQPLEHFEPLIRATLI